MPNYVGLFGLLRVLSLLGCVAVAIYFFDVGVHFLVPVRYNYFVACIDFTNVNTDPVDQKKTGYQGEEVGNWQPHASLLFVSFDEVH